MNIERDRHQNKGIYIWIPLSYCFFAIYLQIIRLIIFGEVKRSIARSAAKKILGQTIYSHIEMPLSFTILGWGGVFFSTIAIIAVVLSGIRTKGWTNYSSWFRVLLPILAIVDLFLTMVL